MRGDRRYGFRLQVARNAALKGDAPVDDEVEQLAVLDEAHAMPDAARRVKETCEQGMRVLLPGFSLPDLPDGSAYPPPPPPSSPSPGANERARNPGEKQKR